MGNAKRSKLKLLLMVAAGLFLLATLLVGAGLEGQRRAAGKAMRTREVIERTLSAPDSFTPPLDAAIAPDRLEVFLDVRADLQPYCSTFSDLAASFTTVDSHVSSIEGSDEIPPREQLAEGLGDARFALASIFRTLPKVNAYGVDRNQALLQHGMGLGEYTFINVVACHSARGLTPGGFLGPGKGARVYRDRVAGQIREMIGRYAALLEERLAAAPPAEREPLERRLKSWRGEYDSLVADPSRTPFVDRLSDELEQVLRPVESRLERLCCPATSELDIARVVKSGAAWYDHR